jgi:ribosomal protein S18 acetylase RimI-like enzyme
VESARPAGPDDLGAIAELARSARGELALLRGGEVWRAQQGRVDPVEDRLRSELTRPEAAGALIVGTVDGTVIGYGATTVEDLSDGSRLAVISDLYVAPEARGIGVGEAMLDLLLAHARSAGASGVDALALPGDRATKNFFETFGLKARAIVVHRSLLDDDAVDVEGTGSLAAGPDA